MVNAASTELTGYSKDEFEHLTIAHLVSEEEQEEASAVLAALEVDEVHQREWRMRTKQGGMRTVEVAVRRRSDGLVQGIARDVTEYRAEFRELVEHNDLLRRVFDALPVWVSVKDAAGHYYLYNQAGQELTATVDTPLEQRTFADLSVGTPEEVAAVEALDRQVLETQAATLPTELNLTLQDGTVHNLLVTKVPLLDQ
ncbi:MAG: PAS domain-containing protein, partial [Gammaproteobacteria bacterium]|nr:PAS domain-containing protein [Gammaproteobacteria bacterium]NIY31803.1 PAS domain-containing protein [Gammaproteobacteria bacterium]